MSLFIAFRTAAVLAPSGPPSTPSKPKRGWSAETGSEPPGLEKAGCGGGGGGGGGGGAQLEQEMPIVMSISWSMRLSTSAAATRSSSGYKPPSLPTVRRMQLLWFTCSPRK